MSSDQRIDVAKVYPGPILLLAGPGTGKTHQLARRIKFLIEEKQVDSGDIAVITFTGEAARNMRERLSDDKKIDVYVAPEKQPKNIRTMHSLAFRILFDDYRKLGLRKDFIVIDDQPRHLLLEDAARMVGFTGEDSPETEECRRHGNCQESDQKKCKICAQYQGLLRGLNAIDYDDQIFLACKLLNENPTILEKWQKSARHLLVDEYQDINEAQYKLIRLLSRGQEDGVFVVADDDQSIYSWRGGSPTHTIKFEDDFGTNARVLRLDECQRCPPHILNAALAIVAKNNRSRLEKPGLHSIRESETSKVIVSKVPSDKYEARVISRAIKVAPVNQDALVLVPGHRFTIPIKRELRKNRIPYDCKTNIKDTGLKVINDLTKWLKDEKDDFALRLCLERIINNPVLKIPFEEVGNIKQKRERTYTKVAAFWRKVIAERISLYSCLQASIDGNDDIKFISASLSELKTSWVSGKKTGEFLEVVCRFVRPWTNVVNLAQEVEDWVEDASARNISGGEPVVRVLTMEAAKGLGCDQVFVIGLNKGVFPPNGLEEEPLREKQRLFYVSMTRAKKKLQIFCAHKREGWISYQSAPDGKETGTLEPSEFIAWLPTTNIEVEEKWSRK